MGDARGEELDPFGQATQGVVEGGRDVAVGGIGCRPVQSGLGVPGSEVLVGAVTDGHDEVGLPLNLVQRPRAGTPKVESNQLGGSDGLRVHARRRAGPGAPGGNVVSVVPEGGRELGTGGVPRADEQEGAWSDGWTGDPDRSERFRQQSDVLASAVPGGGQPLYQSGVLEHVQVMGEEVRRDLEPLMQLRRRAVR